MVQKPKIEITLSKNSTIGNIYSQRKLNQYVREIATFQVL
jgi:hypothetical protein